MNIIADGLYEKLTVFKHPWEFWVIDNFLEEETFNTLLELKDVNGLYSPVDASNGIIACSLNSENAIATKYTMKISNPNIIYSVEQSLIKIQNGIEKEYTASNLKGLFVANELVKCEPGYCYHRHTDHASKIFSIIVSLSPTEGDGTTLLDESNKQYKVFWRPNRATIFINGKSLFHLYKNTLSVNRYTFNIFLTAEKSAFRTDKLAAKTNKG